MLDPACGTGAFLVEVLRHIRRTLETQGLGATLGQRLRKAATERLFGFEILTAPFVVAHLQIGLALRAAGVPLAEGQRAAVYLTNALTGWKPAKDEGQHRLSQEFEAEVEAARHVKRQEKILVVLGNPPYKGQPGLAIEEEREVVEAYRQTVRPEVPKPDGRGLDDLYVRFFRIAERQIAKHTRRGVVAYVTNNSWLDGTSHTAMRERFLDAFDQIWIDNLNGDQKKTGKRTPDGAPDPSIFSTPSNREGIKPGTAVALLTRREDHEGSTATIRYRDFWGADKLTTLDALAKDGSLSGLGVGAPEYAEILPEPALGLPFLPRHVTADYLRWPNLPDLFPTHFPGIQTARDEALVDVDASRLESRMRTYFDPETSDSDAARATPVLLKKTKRFDPLKTRRILKESGYETGYIIPYLYRPFDIRWLYWVNITKLLDEKRSDYLNHMLDNNIWLASQQKPRRDWSPPQIAHAVGCLDVMDRGASFIPLYLAPDLTTGGAVRPNLSRRALDYLKETGATPEDLFHHALAVLHSPSYRADNAGALRQDWPRIPLPSDPSALATTAALGRQLATLLAPETPVSGVTTGSIRPDLRSVAEPARLAGGMLDETAGHTRVTAPWGRFGHTGKVMPGKGKLFPRPLPAAVPPALGPSALDVYLNDDTLWRTVPDRVWAYTLGGYPVLKKWLSYRTEVVLGRPLRLEEVEEFARIARRIAAILLLESELDAGYAAI
ncbi:MAG TPA: type ISP restriction/modification enzyme [Rhodothermales bacterium]|nr:type ISP restriction/modification enzyme [Rhodothermales bacterium]